MNFFLWSILTPARPITINSTFLHLAQQIDLRTSTVNFIFVSTNVSTAKASSLNRLKLFARFFADFVNCNVCLSFCIRVIAFLRMSNYRAENQNEVVIFYISS